MNNSSRAVVRASPRILRGSMLVALAAAAATSAGCYRHVVGVRGLGASETTVHQSAQDDVALGHWFGESPEARRRARNPY